MAVTDIRKSDAKGLARSRERHLLVRGRVNQEVFLSKGACELNVGSRVAF